MYRLYINDRITS